MTLGEKGSTGCWTAAVLYCLLLSHLTLTPDPWWFLGAPGKEVEEAIDSTLADYIQHGGAYLVLAVLFASASSTAGRLCVLICGSLTVLHALGSEWLQAFIPLRICDWSDAAANLGGVLCGWLLTIAMIRYVASSSSQRVLVDVSADGAPTGK